MGDQRRRSKSGRCQKEQEEEQEEREGRAGGECVRGDTEWVWPLLQWEGQRRGGV